MNNKKIIEKFEAKFFKGEFGWHYNKDKTREPRLDFDLVKSFLLKTLSQQKQEFKRVVEEILNRTMDEWDAGFDEKTSQPVLLKKAKKDILKAIEKL